MHNKQTRMRMRTMRTMADWWQFLNIVSHALQRFRLRFSFFGMVDIDSISAGTATPRFQTACGTSTTRLGLVSSFFYSSIVSLLLQNIPGVRNAVDPFALWNATADPFQEMEDPTYPLSCFGSDNGSQAKSLQSLCVSDCSLDVSRFIRPLKGPRY